MKPVLIIDYSSNRLLVIKSASKLFGPQSTEFISTFTESVEELNKAAMRFVQHQDNESCVKILGFCDELTAPGRYGNFPFQRNQTFNNLGCVHRRLGKLKAALNYLKTALSILTSNNLLKYSATTYLNLCAVLSQMGEYIFITKRLIA